MSRSTLFTTLLALSLLAPVGCAVTSSDDAAEQVGENQDELSTVAQSLVGRYYDAGVPFAGIGRLNLAANGTYTADVEAGGRAFCITSPCLLPESGRWNAIKRADGTLRLRLRATGEASRYYAAVKTSTQLTLTQGATTQTLQALATNACLDNADCSSNEECGPKMCLMWCQVGDPFCCGPSTCQPKPPPPPPPSSCNDDSDCKANEVCGPKLCLMYCLETDPGCCGPSTCEPKPPPPPPSSCWGAWLDENGTCRTPADGVYPASCCEPKGETCGNVTCAVGDVCCNPLSSICTKPGMACAF